MRELYLDHSSYVPVSLQLKEQLKRLIQDGVLAPGAKLPSVRELAGFLRINRNTVLRALAELENEGYVRGHQGKGVYVHKNVRTAGRRDGLAALIDATLERASALGVDPRLLSRALLSESQTASPPGPSSVLLVECNRPALRLYRSNLEDELGVLVEPVLIGDLRLRVRDLSFVERHALAVTTFFHFEEVEALLPRALPVVALLPQASLDTLVRLLAVPPGTALGVVCEDPEGIQNLLESLHRAGVRRLQIHSATVNDRPALEELVNQVEVIVSTTECAAELRAMAPGREVVVEDGRLDRSGIELVRRMLEALSLKSRR